MEAIPDADGSTMMKVGQITDGQTVVDRSDDELTAASDEHRVDIIARQTVALVERREGFSVEPRDTAAPRSEIHSAVVVPHKSANRRIGKSVGRAVAPDTIELRSVDEQLHDATLPPADPD